MSEQARSILIRIHEYINSANFNGNDEDRFAGNSAINHIIEGGLDKLSGLSEDQILSHVSNTSVTVQQKPSYSSLGGQISMAVGVPSTLIEAGIRIKEKGLKQGLKETGQAFIGSRPYKLGESARFMTDILAPFGIVKAGRIGKGATSRIADISKKRARVRHIGKTKTRFKSQTQAQTTSKLHGKATVGIRTGTLAEAYSLVLKRPADVRKMKVTARKLMDKVDPQGAATIRRNIDKIIEGKGSTNIKATRIDKLLFEQWNKGAVNKVEMRAFSIYAAEGFKKRVKLPLVSKIRAKTVKTEKIESTKIKREPIVDTTPRIKPSTSPTPEQAVKAEASSIMERAFDEKIKEFRFKSDIAFKKANPQLYKTGRKSKQQLADEFLQANPPQEL